jgi:hypothetical protein
MDVRTPVFPSDHTFESGQTKNRSTYVVLTGYGASKIEKKYISDLLAPGLTVRKQLSFFSKSRGMVGWANASTPFYYASRAVVKGRTKTLKVSYSVNYRELSMVTSLRQEGRCHSDS